MITHSAPPKSIPLGTPIRFVCVRWDDGWEFDCPVVLLEPVIRYSPNGCSSENMIEDACEDIILELDGYLGKVNTLGSSDEDVSREFGWRGWSLDNLRKTADSILSGKGPKRTKYRVTETWRQFVKAENDDGELETEAVEADG